MNRDKDISVKVVDCTNAVNEAIQRRSSSYSEVASHALAELMTSTLLMGAGMDEGVSLQVNIVGDSNLSNILVITDSKLSVRGTVGNPSFEFSLPSSLPLHPSQSSPLPPVTSLPFPLAVENYVGRNGRIEVTRNHSTWKSPASGIVSLTLGSSIAMNLGVYCSQSEQRAGAFISDICLDSYTDQSHGDSKLFRCKRAWGVLAEVFLVLCHS